MLVGQHLVHVKERARFLARSAAAARNVAQAGAVNRRRSRAGRGVGVLQPTGGGGARGPNPSRGEQVGHISVADCEDQDEAAGREHAASLA